MGPPDRVCAVHGLGRADDVSIKTKRVDWEEFVEMATDEVGSPSKVCYIAAVDLLKKSFGRKEFGSSTIGRIMLY